MSALSVTIDGVQYVPRNPIPAGDQDFRTLLKQSRKKLGWTLREAAIAIGCGSTSIFSIETGRQEPTFRMILKIAEAYGLPMYTITAAMQRTIVQEKEAQK